MKRYSLAAVSILLLLGVVACNAEPTSGVDNEATVQAAVQATLLAHQTASAQPTDTPVPDIKATIVVAVEATLTAHWNASAQPPSPPTVAPDVANASERLYRSYPAPTGYPGFRKYYQKRCYPGCHYDVAAGTPTPQAIHP